MQTADHPHTKANHNPITHRQHRREVFWQIGLPLALGIMAAVAAAVAAAWTGAAGISDTSKIAEVSTIWLVTPLMFLTLILLIIILGVIYLLAAMLQKAPPIFLLVQNIFLLMQVRVARLADSAVEPVIRLHGWLRALGVLTQLLRK